MQYDNFCKIKVSKDLASRGIIITDINTAIAKHPDIIKKYFGRLLGSKMDRFVALNESFFNSGVFIYIPEGIVLERPMLHALSMNEKSRIYNRNIIVVGKGSSVTLISSLSSLGSGFYSEASEIYVEAGASLNFVSSQRFLDVLNIINRKALCEEGSKINWMTSTFGGKLTKVKRETVLSEPFSEAQDLEVIFGNGKQHFDIVSNINHEAKDTKSNVFINGALKNNARCVTHGTIYIEKDAFRSDTFLSEHIILLDKLSRADTIPALEIKCSDVKAGHSASVSPVEEDKIFYLESRGFSREEAKKIIVSGFFESVVSKISDENIQKKIRDIIDQKLNE